MSDLAQPLTDSDTAVQVDGGKRDPLLFRTVAPAPMQSMMGDGWPPLKIALMLANALIPVFALVTVISLVGHGHLHPTVPIILLLIAMVATAALSRYTDTFRFGYALLATSRGTAMTMGNAYSAAAVQEKYKKADAHVKFFFHFQQQSLDHKKDERTAFSQKLGQLKYADAGTGDLGRAEGCMAVQVVPTVTVRFADAYTAADYRKDLEAFVDGEAFLKLEETLSLGAGGDDDLLAANVFLTDAFAPKVTFNQFFLVAACGGVGYLCRGFKHATVEIAVHKQWTTVEKAPEKTDDMCKNSDCYKPGAPLSYDPSWRFCEEHMAAAPTEAFLAQARRESDARPCSVNSTAGDYCSFARVTGHSYCSTHIGEEATDRASIEARKRHDADWNEPGWRKRHSRV
jgi:hypothetical protein